MSNVIHISGRLTRDGEPIIKKATGEVVGAKGALRFQHEDADGGGFIDLQTWERVPREVLTTLRKGDKVEIIGSLVFDAWGDKEAGTYRTKVLIDVRSIQTGEIPGPERAA